MKQGLSHRKVTIMIFAVIFLFCFSMPVQAHPAAATSRPGDSHLHIKGRVTTEDGRSLAGLRPHFYAVDLLSNLPDGCRMGGTLGNPPTNTDGYYEILVYLEGASCAAGIDRITVRGDRITWTMEGYTITPR